MNFHGGISIEQVEVHIASTLAKMNNDMVDKLALLAAASMVAEKSLVWRQAHRIQTEIKKTEILMKRVNASLKLQFGWRSLSGGQGNVVSVWRLASMKDARGKRTLIDRNFKSDTIDEMFKEKTP